MVAELDSSPVCELDGSPVCELDGGGEARLGPVYELEGDCRWPEPKKRLEPRDE
jgi:hypothetical protein